MQYCTHKDVHVHQNCSQWWTFHTLTESTDKLYNQLQLKNGPNNYTEMSVLFTCHDLKYYSGRVVIQSRRVHPTPVFPGIHWTQIRDGRCEDSILLIIIDRVFVCLFFCCLNNNVSLATVVPAQVFLIWLITLFIRAGNINICLFISRHMDHHFCPIHTTQCSCKEKTTWNVKWSQHMITGHLFSFYPMSTKMQTLCILQNRK